MGCWNHTCAITNLPIYDNEEVEVILLQSSAGYDTGSFCEPTEYHHPLPLTFTGKYNDYGSVKDFTGATLNIIVDSLKSVLFEMETGANKYHDIAVKRDEFDINKLFELDHENRLYIHNNNNSIYDTRDKCRIKHIVIRKEVYDSIINEMSFERWDSKESKTFKFYYKDLVSEYEQYAKDIDDIMPDNLNLNQLLWRLVSRIGDTQVGDMLSHQGSVYNMQYPIDTTKILFDLRKNDSEDFIAVLDNAVRLRMLISFMYAARKSWHVPSGVGSQDDRTEYQELCAKLTLSSAKIVKGYFEE